ncbi:MAG: hypothetical protein SGI77_09920, partial [Pirellulaceae bacterium]|nr:hypothetical protein [Pirellulaceae bacterium]
MKQRSHPTRLGSFLICVLVCLLVSISLIATSIQISMRSRRECTQSRIMRQTSLLVDAGFSRAIEQLEADDEYRGETWKPTISTLGLDGISVEIEASSAQASSSRNDLQVT